VIGASSTEVLDKINSDLGKIICSWAILAVQ